MGLVGLIAGLVIYRTRDSDRGNRSLEPELSASIAATPATDLIGLGYLPADASLVFVVQPGPALRMLHARSRNRATSS